MLGLKAKSRTPMVRSSIGTMRSSVEKITAVELNSRFGGPDFHCAGTRRLHDVGRKDQLVICWPIENKIVVKAASQSQLRIIRFQGIADAHKIS